MRAAMVSEPHSVSVERVADPTPDNGEVTDGKPTAWTSLTRAARAFLFTECADYQR